MDSAAPASIPTLARLEAVIADRRNGDPQTSYVARLHAKGLTKIAQKLGEEAVETIIAALAEDRAALVGEAADLLFHLLLLLGAKDVPLVEVLAELDRRDGVSGIAEKAARQPYKDSLMPIDTTQPYDSTNIFARILRGELPCNQVYADEWALAFHDIRPQAPVHVLVIPRGPWVSWDDFTARAATDEIAGFIRAVGEVTRVLKLDQPGYRLLVNMGQHGHQEVPHLHVHIFGGRQFFHMVAD